MRAELDDRFGADASKVMEFLASLTAMVLRHAAGEPVALGEAQTRALGLLQELAAFTTMALMQSDDADDEPL